MTQTYFPFDTGSGANVTETQWQEMAKHWLRTGVLKSVLNELQVYADSTGMQVKVKTGAVWIEGHYFESDAEEIMAIGTADATNPRIDRIIVKLDWTANTIQLAVLQGTPSVSPTAPALTQNTSRWEISLAQVRVNAGVTTIAADKITDERNYVKNQNAVLETPIPLVLQAGTTAELGTPRVWKDGAGIVHMEAMLNVPDGLAAGTTIATLPTGYNPLSTFYDNVVGYKASSSAYISTELTFFYNGTIVVKNATYGQYLRIRTSWRTDV